MYLNGFCLPHPTEGSQATLGIHSSVLADNTIRDGARVPAVPEYKAYWNSMERALKTKLPLELKPTEVSQIYTLNLTA